MRWQGPLETMASQEGKHAANRGAVARRLVAELRPHRAVITAAFVFIVLNAIGQAAGPWMVSRAIDHDIVGHDPRGLLRSIGILFGIYLTTALCQRAQTRRIGETGQHLLAELRARLFLQLQALPLSFFDKRPIGDLMSRLLSDVDTLNQLFSQGLTQLLGSVLALVGI
ncbi:MAG TPA: ABC transporter transmembrane domain-containing protein, partial [Polyangia bacterium]